jgi:rubrerythrin
MELLTFGAVLSFAIGMEERAEEFYLEAAKTEACRGVGEELLALARQNGKHRSRLVETRQENVTEMVLEPIRDLDSAAYENEAKLSPDLDCRQILDLALEIEGKAQSFYADASGKAKHLLAGVARTFNRLGRDKARRVQQLEALER